MTEKHDIPRGPGGRPRNHDLDGTSRARGRTLRDAPAAPKTRYEQLQAEMRRQRLEPGDHVAWFASLPDEADFEHLVTPRDLRIVLLASDYSAFEGRYGKRSALVRELEPFSAAELAAIVAGDGPVEAPWPVQDSGKAA